ncbi:hypothetical protein V2J09_023588 [Rumex salicifolius]
MENSIADKLESQVLESKHIFMKPIRPITLKFEDVVFKIKVKPTQKKEASTEREILKGISGIVTPGEMLAILGPSGSGKTTLLTALGGRLGGSLAGNITYNNKPFSNNLKRAIGFVTQDDVHYANLTVTETLVYTALLRLPNTLTKDQKMNQAESVMYQLNLKKCKDSIIGGPFLRGVSGGERKRVSIGQEMLINPSLLLLDEPTSGLDSTNAQKIVSMLAELAKGGTGRAVLVTIHQPSSKLFYMFNKVLLLSDGSPLYFGRGDAVMDYFRGVGFAPLLAMNPADFLVDLANGVSPDDSVEDQSDVKSTLVAAYKSNLIRKVKLECEELGSDLITEKSDDKKQVAKWATSWYQQFSILLQRGLKERKHQSFSKLKIMQILAITLLSGLLWWKSESLQDQIGLLFFYSAFWSFFPMFHAIFAFPPERLMLTKERTSGTYRLSPYFIAQIVSDLPMELLLPIASFIIVYFMAGLKHTPAAFFYSLSVLVLNVMVSQGLGLALGAVFMDQKKAIVLGTVLTLGFQLAGGYYVQDVPSFISWIKYVSIMQYSYKLMLGSQYSRDDTYPCGSDMCLVKDFASIKSVGLGMQLFSAVMLLAMFFLYRGIAYVALMRIGAPPK